MAVQPRTRTRRAVNLEAVPEVPLSETKAREAYTANKQKNHWAGVEKAASLEAHKAFAQEQRSSFEFLDGNQTVVVEMAAQKDANEVSTAKLYALVGAGEITLDQFVSVVGATQGDVKKVLGTNVLAKVLVSEAKQPKFTIRDKKPNEA